VRVPFVDLWAQQAQLASELKPVLLGMLERTDWVLGSELESFEHEFADYCGVDHAVGTDSGLSALELVMRASGIGPGDEVITAANTFIATVLAISHAGASPELVDIDPHTDNLDPAQLERAITPRTKAVIPVHLYGHPAEMDAIRTVADVHGLLVIEDACQAHGARYHGRPAGSLGHAAAFSFYPAKNLGAFGDGGAVVTDNPELAESVRTLRDYGQRRKYHHVAKGFNRRLDTLQAAVLRVKLRHLDGWNDRRRQHAAAYTELLKGTGLSLPQVADGVDPVWHLYVVRASGRDALRSALADHGVQSGLHYPVPVHLQPAYADLRRGRGSFPVTELHADELVSLPMYPELSEGHIDYVATTIRKVLPRLGHGPLRRGAA
jgi:dTDP-4-amino-4,6-dideoxygalactose transaminase